MWLDTLKIAQQWAVILLALEIFILSLAPLLILYYITKWLRTFLPKVVPALREGRRWVLQALAVVDHIIAAIRAPFVWMIGASAAIKVWVAKAQQFINQGH